MKRPIQIITLLFSISLFAGYVVYSQLTRTNTPTNTFAPSSKSRQIDLPKQAWALDQQTASNLGATNQARSTVATNSTNASPPPAPPPFLPGSKFGAVLTPSDAAALVLQPSSNGGTNGYQILRGIQPGSTEMIPSSKALILLSPAQLTNVVIITNTPNP